MSDKIDLRLPWQKALDLAKENGNVPEGIEEAFMLGFMYGETHAQNKIIERFENFARGFRVDK